MLIDANMVESKATGTEENEENEDMNVSALFTHALFDFDHQIAVRTTKVTKKWMNQQWMETVVWCK